MFLIFWIPGTYLEFPADPWDHFARINEWSGVLRVTDNPHWTKASYFLAYSLVGAEPGNLWRLDLYGSGCSLLLCWQYYRLAAAVGLRHRACLGFAIVQALLLGNNLFGFYRYYGISSSLFAQLGAVTLTRLAWEWARAGFPARTLLAMRTGWRQAVPLCVPVVLLFTLIACNHAQGLVIAVFGVASAAGWRVAGRSRRAAAGLAALLVVASVAAGAFWPRDPQAIAAARSDGWLSGWLGFNLFSIGSPAFERAGLIVGWLGGFDLLAAVVLVRRNHPAAWLALTPVVLLCLPLTALPALQALAAHGEPIFTFHRFLFAIPSGLALVALLEDGGRRRITRAGAIAAGVLALLALVVLPPESPICNRLYNLLSRPAADLVSLPPDVGAARPPASTPILFAAPEQMNYILRATGHRTYEKSWRPILGESPPQLIEQFRDDWKDRLAPGTTVVLRNWQSVVTAASASGMMSGHWPAQFVAEGQTGEPELIEFGKKRGEGQGSIPGASLFTVRK
ncbi:MAG TPA: hypothetical protein VGM73_11735 [Candidatus Didemnitutus sp.]